MKYISLNTEIPNKRDVADYKLFEKFEARSMHGQLPIVWSRAKDFTVEDRYGNKFIDFTSGICVANLGHGNDRLLRGIEYCLEKPLLHSYTFPTEVRFAFLRELVETCYPEGKAFLVSAGTEATEVACKLMRMYGLSKQIDNYNEYSLKRNVIVSFRGAMHGRTLLTEQLKGTNYNNEWSDTTPDPRIFCLDFPKNNEHFDIDPVLEICKEEICGFIIESYQGWSASFYPKHYIKELVEWAKQNDILVCFDEIQSGFGRTGKMFAFEHYGLTYKDVDLICCGKGISGSLPLSAVIGRKDILDLPEVGSMSSTHSANPLSCAVGLTTLLEFAENKIIKQAEEKGKLIQKEMYTWKFDENKIEKIQGVGMVWAIITKTEEEASRIVWECFKKGLLLIWTHKNSVKIGPPITIKEEALIEGLNVIKEVLND